MPAPRTTTALPAKRTTAILAIICISYFMVILDNSIMFTGLPRIESAMGFSPGGLTWVHDAYTLVFGGLLLGARAGDTAGRPSRPATLWPPGSPSATTLPSSWATCPGSAAPAAPSPRGPAIWS